MSDKIQAAPQGEQIPAVALQRLVSQLAYEESEWLKRRRYLQAAIGAEMRAVRKRSKISQGNAAKKMDISAPYLSEMELGRRGPCLETVRKFLRALDFG